MLKKNQVLLILLTLVLMLSVYYIRSPFKTNEKDGDDSNTPVTQVEGRMEELQSLRVVLNEERTAQVLSLDAIIADNDKTVDEKSKALEEKRYLNSLTEKELLLEVQIINKGYRDAFVHATSDGVEITVVSDNNSVTVANEIVLMAMTGFDRVFDNVTVSFQTAQEVMGTASTE